MTCECGSERVVNISGKCNDLSSMTIPHLGVDHHGYMPDLGLVGGLGDDYIQLAICIDCGRVQDWEPQTDDELIESLKDNGIDINDEDVSEDLTWED